MTSLVPISEVAEVNPRLPAGIASDDSRPVDFVPMNSLKEDGRIVFNGHRPLGEVRKGFTYFEDGDVIVAKITPCLENGKAAIAEHLPHKIAFGSTEFHVLRPTKRICGRYLFYMVWNDHFRSVAASRMQGAAGQKRVPTSFIEQFRIPIPCPNEPQRSLAEQRRIAAILDKADAIRRKRREINRTTEDLIPSLFSKTFLQYLKMPIADMPKLGDPELSEIASGVTKGRQFNGQPTVIVPYIRVANVQDGYLELNEIKTIEALPSDVDALRLRHGDVLMTEGGDFDKLGRGAMWEADIPNCIHQNHVFRVRCNRHRLLPVYFAHYIRTEIAHAYFLQCAKKTSNLASMNMTQLKATPVACPPIDLQQQFCTEMKGIDAMRGRHAVAARDAESLFNSLVTRAFRGDL